ncbi:glycosyl hydrolase family 28-related protein [Agromyces larvae]|uniref:Right-handed parallel beta-helix repeat-containing protein n=1 Tax=Agromyces larvae TaxID=2929802 RepID=A0ABY4C1E2_9MICO|nr:glycosyl hydrolase family 28-related protein [Agromyces larvae]UOE45247.1 right-handed parallel beta-helix repeat-containing protein [Agromyces larvae]
MTSPNSEARPGRRLIPRPTALAVALIATGGLLVPALPAAAAPAAPAPVVTRTAIDPALVAGRGADVPFLEQEAEHARTNGTVLAPSRDAYTLAAEASGRSAVQLAPTQWVEFTLPAKTNAITVRYSIPDAPNGGGITSPLEVTVNGKDKRTVTLTSQYSWLYNQYPFTNDPNAGLLHPDWWLAECGCVPGEGYEVTAPFRPMHFYDEQRLLLGKTYRAGDVIRLTVPRGAAADLTTIDLLDTEQVGLPHIKLIAANVLLFGADPLGKRDSANAFDKAIAAAKKLKLPVYVPPGVYQVNRHIIVDDVTIEGAGAWYTVIRGSEVALGTPAPDGSVHTGVGFYGKPAAEGGSRNVRLSGFTIRGDVRERIDTDQVNGIGGAMSDSVIEDLHIEHTKVGLWFDGPMNNTVVRNLRVVDQIADGLNFHTGVTNSRVEHTFVRNTGDDGLAMWAEGVTNAGNTFSRNTVQTPTLANGIAIYGGTDLTVSGNLVADPIREGSGIHLGSRFGAEPFAGTVSVADNTTVRASTLDLNWNIGLGALWFYALDRSIDGADIQITGDHFLDSTYSAIMLVTEWGVKDAYRIENLHFRDLRVDGVGTNVVSARTAGSATFENVDVRNVGHWGVNNCGAFNWDWVNGSEFTLQDLGGNDGVDANEYHLGTPWLAPYLPNLITCNDRPPLTAPPAPSPWVQP